MLDQCPSSTKHDHPATDASAARPTARTLVSNTGKAYWRELDEVADTKDFRDRMEKEFPAGASELLAGGRRTFMKLMGASLAMAGVAAMPGCRRPDHKILPYSRTVPEDIIPGKPLYFATSMTLPGGGVEGLVVETHEGRPTKIEGNPLHPVNQGKSSLWSQAAILELYDPDRLKDPAIVRKAATATTPEESSVATWDDFDAWSEKHFARFASDSSETKLRGGKGLAFIAPRKNSVAFEHVRSLAMARFPGATWVAYDALANENELAGLTSALGKPAREVCDLTKAAVVVAVERDFHSPQEPMGVAYSRQWANRRRVMRAGDEMGRLYAIESSYSTTGGSADHRLRVRPSQAGAFLVALASALLEGLADQRAAVISAALRRVAASNAADAEATKFAKAVADDLLANSKAGKPTVVMAGASLPSWAHALVCAINSVLGNVGKTVSYLELKGDLATSGTAALAALCAQLDRGEIDTVVTLNRNPCFNAPADLGFAAKFLRAPHRITLAYELCETALASTWRLNSTHELESWGDTISDDGTIAPIQPMIAPLFFGRSELEVLAMIAGVKNAIGYDLTREAWRKRVGEVGFDKAWNRALHDGVLATPGPKPTAMSVAMDKVAEAVAQAAGLGAGDPSKMEIRFATWYVGDGRFTNHPWLHELPEPASKIVWDNAALISPATAKKLGAQQTADTDRFPQARMISVSLNGATVQIPAWATPGVADDTLILPMGYGRRSVGVVGQGVGVDVSPLRTTRNLWAATDASVSLVESGERWFPISVTQSHSSMEGRAIIREIDQQAWAKHGDTPIDPEKRDTYGRKFTSEETRMAYTLAERLEGSEMAKMPATVGIYTNPYNNRESGYSSANPSKPTPGVAAFDRQPQWGMTIDLSTCTGCNVCTIACQAENNIPVVGKKEVQKGREMHWIRVDRYFRSEVGRDTSDPEAMIFQPVACVHCEKAPCETVCPVNATVHGPEGHNYMVYNRCIGTRYCANNCPYKVRRFNFFDYGVTKINGNYFGKDALEGVLPGALADSEKTAHRINPHLIPPRLRQKLEEISKLQKNPNVTVRSRGVMEKCTYCIQRTNEAKIDLKIRWSDKNWRPEDGIPDGFVQTACQQACPTNSIIFGDISDTKTEYNDENGKRTGSLVHNWRNNNRSYLLLGYLNTRPRTSYLLRVNNPNPALRTPETDPFGSEGGHGAAAAHGSLNTIEHTFVDPQRRSESGYRLSLGILSGGVHA
jgi:MoCo/4Fe-4S cofactor protein with predicted Tat translocation signal